MKVAILGSFPPQGGISAYCLELARALSRILSLEFISFSKMYPERIHSSGKINDDTLLNPSDAAIKVYRKLIWYNPITWILQAFSLKIDIFHVQWWSWFLGPIYLTIMTIIRIRKIPIVTTIHNVRPHENNIVSDIFQRIVVMLSDHVIVHSKDNQKTFLHIYKLPLSKVSIIPHGLLFANLKEAYTSREAKKRLSIDPGNETILFFGTIREYKGLKTLIKATSKLFKEIPNIRLIIAGRPWGKPWKFYTEFINSLQLENNIISRLDYIKSDQIPVFFDAADIVVLPYLHFNSQSGVGLIALARKKPLIVTDVGSLSELILDRDYIVPPGNADALYKSMAKAFLSTDELKKMEYDARIMSKKFEWETIAKKTMKLYEALK